MQKVDGGQAGNDGRMTPEKMEEDVGGDDDEDSGRRDAVRGLSIFPDNYLEFFQISNGGRFTPRENGQRTQVPYLFEFVQLRGFTDLQSCVLQKSMKSDSCCPVCKVPSSRREVRPAPHMENLVQIYKSMETASGVNIFVTQNAPPTKSSEYLILVSGHLFHLHQDEEEAEKGSNSRNTKCGTKGKKSRTSKSKLKSSGTKPVRPSFHTNKRVQVPKTPLPETSIRLETSEPEGDAMNCVPNSEVPNDYTSLSGNSNQLLGPLFWLIEEDAEKLSQSTNIEHLTLTPVDIPNFSDIKDSDDDIPDEVSLREVVSGKPNVANLYDSEKFECTQRAGSPEISFTPIRIRSPSTDDKGSPDKVSKRCSKGGTGGRVIKEISDKINSPGKSSVKDNAFYDSEMTDKPNGSCESRKRTRNGRIQNQGKGTKKSQANAAAGDSVQGSIPDQGCVLHSHLDQLVEKEPLDQVDKASKLPIAPCIEKVHEKGITMRNRKNSKSNQSQRKLQAKSALQKSSFLKIDPIREVTPSQQKDCEGRMSDLSKSSSIRVDDNRTTSKGRESRKRERKMDVLTDVSIKDKQGDIDVDIQAESADPMGPHHSVKDESLMRKCQSISNRSICGFCHSAEETEFSGEMINYVQGKPVSSDFVGGSSIIYSHKNCTEWSPNVYFQNDIAINLEAELTRSRRIKCSLCCEKGAALGCYDKSCRRSFHVPCAKQLKESRWDTDNFVMLCPLHASSKLPNEQSEPQVKRKDNPKCTQSQAAINHVTHTSLWGSRGSSDKLHLCFSALTTGEKEFVTKFKRLSGASVSKNWNTSVTHVIASTDENGACKRTLKVLMGILEGKWILSIEWIKACLNARRVVDESSYEIKVDTHGIKEGPRLGRLRLENKQPKIFAGISFYLTGDFEPLYKGYLHDLIVSAGGNILHRKPIVEDQGNLPRDSSLPSTIIVYSVELPNKDDINKDTILNGRQLEAEALAKTSGSIAASNFWVLNCISGYKLFSQQSSMI
ncbi:hypothetical protein V2J09_004388 [Rumex salicifolius]